ncbi:MAG TPA: bifunctional tetrahydrofolate synthase/dihydrofolate synthase [Steroidobacteraceae bacterium]|nr:bifunctional tetrahydrofolate synthase/dihydrofolate synthase [Steroidobacteraceae bacterium]
MRSLAEWLEQQQRSHPRAIDLSLSRVREVARRLDLLTPKYRVITVGGTNGKGSTVAFLDALLRAAGLHCGRFTSPHLARYNERICVDGVEVNDAGLIETFERIDAARGDITLTFFEYNALAALDLFRRVRVGVAVLEVGLGGRFDATNIIDADVAVVCSIGIDHVDWLGHTLEAIGREKAGIFRAGRPAVLGTADVPRSVWTVIEEVGARAVVPDRDYFFHSRSSAGEATWDFEYGAVSLRDLPCPALAGVHQTANAATALAAIVAAGGIELTHTNVSRALRDVRLRGRFQRVPGEVEWVLDVAHNVPAALGLAANLRALPPARTIAVCGILGDKDVPGIMAALSAGIDAWVLVTLDGPRAVPTADLAAHLPRDAHILAHAADVAAGCRAARDAARPGDRILVFGSFLTVGPALEFLGL